MAGKLNIFNFGDLGVDVVKSPIHIPDGAWRQAQNAEFSDDESQGGIKKRASLTKLNSIALAGTVQAIENVPFSYPGVVTLMVGLNAADSNGWKSTPDGTTFTNILATALQRVATEFTLLWGAAMIPRDQRAASFNGRFYFPGDNYTVDVTAPLVVAYDGTTQYEQFRIPNNPAGTTVPRWIADFFITDNFIYLSVYDNGGSAPDHRGRVLRYDPVNGTLTQMGNRFGNGTGENTAGFPFCLTFYLGRLWAGTYGVSGNNQGKVYSMQPGVDESWTLELTGTLHNGYYMSLCPYNGNLYAATDADGSGTAIIQQRTSTGTWSTSLSAPASNTAFFSGLISFNGLLFAGYYNSVTPKTLVKVYDGSSWTTDRDITVSDGVSYVPGKPIVFRGNLYWPFYDLTSDSGTTYLLKKRTTAGVWSTVLTSGIRGGVGIFVPRS